MATLPKKEVTMDDWMDMINNTVPSNGSTKHLLQPRPNPPDDEHDAHSTDSDSEPDINYLLDCLHDTVSVGTRSNGPLPPSLSTANHPPKPPNGTSTKSASTATLPLLTATPSSLDALKLLLPPPPSSHPASTRQRAPSQPPAVSLPPPVPEEAPCSAMHVVVRTLAGHEVECAVEPSDTVKSLKVLLFQRYRIWPQHQRLVYGGDTLTDKHSLSMLGIRDRAILYMVLTTVCSNHEEPKTVAVQKLNGDIFYISCTSSDSVQTVKRTILNQEGYELEAQILVFKCQRMENDKLLRDYDIQNQSVLQMLVRNTRFDSIRDDEEEDTLRPAKGGRGPAAKGKRVEEEEQKLLPFTPQIMPRGAPSGDLMLSDPDDGVDVKALSHDDAPSGPSDASDAKGTPSTAHTAGMKGAKGDKGGNVPSHPLEPRKGEEKAAASCRDVGIVVPPEARASVAGAEDVAALSPGHETARASTATAEAQKSVGPTASTAATSLPRWTVGELCYRKGREYTVKAIDYATEPPSVIIASCSDPSVEVNTEFTHISKGRSSSSGPSIAKGGGAVPPNVPAAVPPVVVPPVVPVPIVPAVAAVGAGGGGVVGTVPVRRKEAAKAPRRHLFSPSLTAQLMAIQQIKGAGAGLKNLGNSSFMNATLQCLAFTQVFQNYICQKMHTATCTVRPSGDCLMCLLHRLLPQMINHCGYVCTPKALFHRLPLLSPALRAGRQEDAHEFWTALAKHLQAAVVRAHRRGRKLAIAVEETSVVYKIWGGHLRSQIRCAVCRKGSNTYDSYIDLSLEIGGCHSVEAALRRFTVQERLERDNKYFCAHCKAKQNAMKQLTIFDAPNILILHLKRFEFGSKIDNFVRFDATLDLTPFMSKSAVYREKGIRITYTLYAVLIHAGRYSNCGHYYCYVRTASNKWYLCNDETVQSSTRARVLQQNGYMFFYQRDGRKTNYP